MKIFKIILGILKTCFVILLIAFIAVVCLQRFSGNKISFLNYRMFTVLTGSMEPKYKVGDILLSKEIDTDKIKVGDDVSYLGKEGSFRDKTVTHQVIKIEKNDEGEKEFHTQGLANSVQDPVVYEEQIFGVVVYKSILLSMIYKIVATKTGMFLFVIIPLMIIIISEIIATALDKEDKKRKAN